MKYCPFCGKELPTFGDICPNCGQNVKEARNYTTDNTNKTEASDKKIGGIGLLYFFLSIGIPFIGLIFYLLFRKTNPGCAKASIMGYGIRVVMIVLLSIVNIFFNML